VVVDNEELYATEPVRSMTPAWTGSAEIGVEPGATPSLDVHVYDYHRVTADRLLGSATVELRERDDWLPVGNMLLLQWRASETAHTPPR
jgi:Ca2+-dependent lipid-binding protein